MGFNTVAFVLNDLSHELEKSPRTVAHMLSHAPMGYGKEEQYYLQMYRDIAKKNSEPVVHEQALRVLPPFHADNIHYFMAGRNEINNLKFVKYHTLKGRKCVLLELPEYMQENK